MAILETGFIFNQTLLVEKKFYPVEGFLTKQIQTSLISGIQGLAEFAFKDEIQKITIGEYIVLFKTKQINQDNIEGDQKKSLIVYCITEQNSNFSLIFEAMDDILAIFLNRYSFFDIKEAGKKKFKKFSNRIEKRFGDLALNLEDRFKSLY